MYMLVKKFIPNKPVNNNKNKAVLCLSHKRCYYQHIEFFYNINCGSNKNKWSPLHSAAQVATILKRSRE